MDAWQVNRLVELEVIGRAQALARAWAAAVEACPAGWLGPRVEPRWPRRWRAWVASVADERETVNGWGNSEARALQELTLVLGRGMTNPSVGVAAHPVQVHRGALPHEAGPQPGEPDVRDHPDEPRLDTERLRLALGLPRVRAYIEAGALGHAAVAIRDELFPAQSFLHATQQALAAAAPTVARDSA